VTTKGFKWNLNNQLMEYGGIISSSNELDKDILRVHTNTPIVFTLELKSAESFLE
jgi:thiamine pyrophosphokinase